MVGDLLAAQQDAALVVVDAGQEPAYAVAGLGDDVADVSRTVPRSSRSSMPSCSTSVNATRSVNSLAVETG